MNLIDEMDLVYEMGDVTLYEFMVLRHLSSGGPKFKTRIMQELIEEFPDDIEHGEYLIPGKQYSDDIDEAVEQLRNDGRIKATDKGLVLTEYGRDLYSMFIIHPEAEVLEVVADFIENRLPEGP